MVHELWNAAKYFADRKQRWLLSKLRKITSWTLVKNRSFLQFALCLRTRAPNLESKRRKASNPNKNPIEHLGEPEERSRDLQRPCEWTVLETAVNNKKEHDRQLPERDLPVVAQTESVVYLSSWLG